MDELQKKKPIDYWLGYAQLLVGLANIVARFLDRHCVLIGGIPSTVLYAGLTYLGVFQIDIQVPNGIASGDQPITLQLAGQASQGNVFLTFAPN